MDPLTTLQTRFGYPGFRLHQEAIVNALLANRDAFALMPTGAGKSLCYQLPALLRDGLTIVVSPLIALMKNQVDHLVQRGIPAAYINSSQSLYEQESVMAEIHDGNLKLLYLAPERLLARDLALLRRLATCRIALVAIDEAHCISQWGFDFRPEYRLLSKVKEVLPNVPVIALTATADKLTQHDIIDKLALNNPAVFISPLNRPNIRYTVKPRQEEFLHQLLEFLDNRKGQSGIIYCLSRRSTEMIASELTSRGIAALPYHAGMDRQTREKHQEKFLCDEISIIVATIAFGMGIDKPNVRFVVHMNLPKCLESYYQETGRAGRDGKPCDAFLLYHPDDVDQLQRFAIVDGNAGQTEIQLGKLDAMREFCEVTTCRRKFLLDYFNETIPDNCGNCDVCLEHGDHFDVTLLARQLFHAIKCVHEPGGVNRKYGINYVVDLLRGSNENRLHPLHRQSNAFASGASLSREAWSRLVFELIEQGYISQSRTEYRALFRGDKSTDVLNGTAWVLLERNKDLSAAWSELQGERLPYERRLYDALLTLRTSLAAKGETGLPDEGTLLGIATYLPLSLRELAGIRGFGPVRLERYGRTLLEVIRRYCAQHKLSSRMAMMKGSGRLLRYDREQRQFQQSLTLFRLGYSVDQVAALRKISREAVSRHMEYFDRKGVWR